MSNTASLKKEYADRIAPALKSQFQYSSTKMCIRDRTVDALMKLELPSGVEVEIKV